VEGTSAAVFKKFISSSSFEVFSVSSWLSDSLPVVENGDIDASSMNRPCKIRWSERNCGTSLSLEDFLSLRNQHPVVETEIREWLDEEGAVIFFWHLPMKDLSVLGIFSSVFLWKCRMVKIFSSILPSPSPFDWWPF